MKFKLIKDKEFFQIVCDKKSVREIIDGDVRAYEIEGYASTKDKDRMNDIVEPTAFESTLKQYMTNPIVLLQHDMDKPIGTVTEASIDNKGLFIKARITEDTDGVFSKLKNGVLRTFSIGYSVKDYETMENVDSEGNYIFTNIIKALELFEISLVSVPANPFALVKSFDSCFVKEEDEVETKEENNEQESEEIAHEEEAGAENEEKVEEEETKDEEVEEEKEEQLQGNVEIHKENEDEEGKVVEGDEEVVEEEKEPKEEEKEEEIVEEVKEVEEIENKEEEKADENSEISTESDCENSENDSESESNEEEIVEKHDDEIVENSKSMNVEFKGIEKAEFNSFVKSFNDKLDEKDAEIKALKTQLNNHQELMKCAIEMMMSLDHAVKNTAIQSGSSYSAPATKNTGYGKVAELLKKMQQ